jgi:tRNA nucleotidyltransferase/poly(A) polymerase
MFNIRTIPGAEALNDAFTKAGFELRLVGGAVRDILLGETPKDFDFATDATPDEMKAVAKSCELRLRGNW